MRVGSFALFPVLSVLAVGATVSSSHDGLLCPLWNYKPNKVAYTATEIKLIPDSETYHFLSPVNMYTQVVIF